MVRSQDPETPRHSLGGPVSVQLALDHPDRVSGLILLDPTMITPAGEVAKVVSWVSKIARLLRTPGVGHAMAFLLRRTVARQIRGSSDWSVR
jgi:pimeloyl-ACP methyl ester carboxylesterase